MELSALLSDHRQVGQIEWMSFRPAKHVEVSVCPSLWLSEEEGIIGDHYHGQSHLRQVTIIQHEHLEVVKQLLNRSVDPSLLRRNLAISGINVHALRKSRIRIGPTVILEGTGDCHPCSRMEKNLGPGGYQAMLGHGGITCKVIVGGEIKLHDQVRMI